MISIVLCTWNNCERLSITLAAFARCEPPPVPWEIAVVANNCTDNTQAVARRYEAKLPIRFTVEPQQGLSRAKNTGLLATSGDLIIFADDDIKPGSTWLTAYWHAFQQNPTETYFGGSVESEFESAPPSEMLLKYAPWSVVGLDLGQTARSIGETESFISANWAVPRAGIESIGSFDVSLGLGSDASRVAVGEETDVQGRLRKAGWRGVTVPGATVSHFVPSSKTDLKHIAERCAATAYIDTNETIRASSHVKSLGPFLLGAPRWTIRAAIEAWAKYCWRRIAGGPDVDAYMDFCRQRAAIRAWRNYRSESRAQYG